MGDPFEVGVSRRAAGDHYSDWLDDVAKRTQAGIAAHPLDGEDARKLHRRLMDWFFHERSKQAENRLEMALDADFYDGMQWDPEDAAAVSERGQVPLVYNEVAPMIDWLIGTERRTRVDWKVLPRTEDDVEGAAAKTKVIKFVSDINRLPFNRSRAFADSVKVGLGWVDDGARDDPTQDVLYDKYEDWRNVLYDSSSYELDLSDARYLFRWRWVDEDIAIAMFPQRADLIRRAVVDAGATPESEIDDDWYLGEPVASGGHLYASGGAVYGEVSRRRVKLIECQYRMPVQSQMVVDGPHKGAFINEGDGALLDVVQQSGSEVIDKVVMRTHFAVFIEAGMISMATSSYRHNRFSLTPIWCYRRGKDRMPYGAVRRIRDIQQDLNKRASKALFLLSTNQIIADKGAVDDPNVAREEADRPDGYIEKNAGKEFKLHRDTDAATGQIQMMTLDAQSIQKSAGINNENLGRQTNAISGEAIKARQLQGSVGTTEPFDNLRLAVQVQGEKILSLVEQFYTEEKVVRITGMKGKVEWLKVNQPELQPDGSVRYINDLTAAAADFVVAEQDYSGTLRQVMFDAMLNIAGRLPPEIAVRFLRMAYEYSDMPNKDEIADEIRKITGEQDPDRELSPEEAAQAEEQMRAQAEAMQIQRESALAALEEQKAKVAKLNAEAAKIMAEAQGGDGVSPEYENALRQVQEQAATRLEAMSEQLRKVQTDAANKTMAINRDADTKIEVARIQSSSQERIAELNKANEQQMQALMKRLDAIGESVSETAKQANEANRAAEAAAKAAEKVGKGAEDAAKKADEAGKVAADAVKAAEKVSGEVEKAAKQATEKPVKSEPVAAPTPQPVTINFEAGAIQVDAKTPAASKTITMQIGDKTVKGEIKAGEGDK